MNDEPKIIRGDDVSFIVEITDENDDAVDITDAIVFFTAKRRKADEDEDAAIALEQDSHIFADGGKTVFNVPKETTGELAIGDYYYDIQVKFVDGSIRSARSGILTVIPDITLREE